MDAWATCSAPVNIALIKYWGKRDDGELILPLHDSLSVTLSQDELRTVTSVAVGSGIRKSRMWLNGEEVPLASSPRIARVVDAFLDREDARNGDDNRRHLHIVSENNFPTAAGLASSAAGLACLVYTLATLLKFKESYPGELTTIARRGSGSACRSLHGGFVRWHCGSRHDGVDSIAEQIVDESHWTDLRVTICVVNDRMKDVSSSAGMQNSVRTSPLIEYRRREVVSKRTEQIIRKILSHDFAGLADVMMRDSNEFHAICLDTHPPIFYLNDVSKRIIALVHAYNDAVGETRAAYTFDAGPNAVILTLAEHVDDFRALLRRCFPPKCPSVPPNETAADTAQPLPAPLEKVVGHIGVHENCMRYFIHTKNGEGPRRLGDDCCLIDLKTGLPK